MATKEVLPTLGATSFTCPHCGAFAHQFWSQALLKMFVADERPLTPVDYQKLAATAPSQDVQYRYMTLGMGMLVDAPQTVTTNTKLTKLENLFVTRCFACKRFAVWIAQNLVYPESERRYTPLEDMPEEVKSDFLEASLIVDKSPRGAAALLRLALQKLMPHVGGKGSNINNDIAALVKNGLEPQVQKVLDVVRVIGNNAVHPGTLDLQDDKDTARTLFELLNLIVEKLISTPKHVNTLFESLPEDAKKSIEKRDNPRHRQ